MHTQSPNVLVLSSGGLKAAWQVGVVTKLAERGQQWDVVCGCSAGAFNAAFLAMYDVGDEQKACADLQAFWTGYGASLKRPGCIWTKFACRAMFSRAQSIESPRLLHDICTIIDTNRLRASNRQLHVLASSLSTGGRVFTKDYPYIREAIIASMSVPGLFPPQKLVVPGGTAEWFVDGAVSTSVPHHLATTNDINVDIVMAAPVDLDCHAAAAAAAEENANPPTMLQSMTKSVQVCMSTSTKRAIRALQDNHANRVNFYQPDSQHTEMSFYNMTASQIEHEITRGYRSIG